MWRIEGNYNFEGKEMRPFIEKMSSDGSDYSGRTHDTPPKRRWPGRITSKLSLAAANEVAVAALGTTTIHKAAIESLTARSDSSSDKSLSCSTLESGDNDAEEEVEDWFGDDDEEVGDWLEETDGIVV